MNTQQISTKQVSVKRYLPDSSAEPFWQQYELPVDDSTSLLDALNHIKEQLDSTLSYRWSCRMAICGSCGVMVNGIPKLGCKTFCVIMTVISASSRYPTSLYSGI